MVHFEYFAHACFLFHFGPLKLLIDPYSPEIGYKFPERGADYVFISHSHFDHNHLAGVSGRTTPIRGGSARDLGGVKAYGVMADHDDQGGASRGHVQLFCFEGGGVRYLHLSDLGHRLRAEQLAEIGPRDVVMVPVGGGECTLDAARAVEVLAQLKPRLVVPMHYRTPFLSRVLFPQIDTLEPFLKKAAVHYGIQKTPDGVVRLDSLPDKPTVLVVPHLY